MKFARPMGSARRPLAAAAAVAVVGLTGSAVATATPTANSPNSITSSSSSATSTSTASPNGGLHGRERCNSAIEERNLAVFESYLDDLFGGDVAAAQRRFTRNAVVEVHGSVPYAGTYPARGEAYPRAQQPYWQPPTADQIDTERPQLLVDCNQLILRGQFQRTAVATGQVVDVTVVEYFTFTRHGRISRDDFYFTDTALVNQALGT
jgi:ketosteroid isomerase-like protein